MKKKIQQKMKKTKIEREREREITFFVWEKYAQNGKESQIYSKS